MSSLYGIVVNLKMGNNGTDDHIYIGIHGPTGGREFPLNVADFDDFEKNSDVTYALGTVWEGEAISGAAIRHPILSQNLERNGPLTHQIWVEQVNSVYIRKSAIPTKNHDDECNIESVIVTLYGFRPIMRIFKGIRRWGGQPGVSDINLSNETGLQHWLREEEPEEPIEKRLPEEKGQSSGPIIL